MWRFYVVFLFNTSAILFYRRGCLASLVSVFFVELWLPSCPLSWPLCFVVWRTVRQGSTRKVTFFKETPFYLLDLLYFLIDVYNVWNESFKKFSVVLWLAGSWNNTGWSRHGWNIYQLNLALWRSQDICDVITLCYKFCYCDSKTTPDNKSLKVVFGG